MGIEKIAYDGDKAIIEGKRYERIDHEGGEYLVRVETREAYRVLHQALRAEDSLGVRLKDEKKIDELVERYITAAGQKQEW